MNSKNKNQIIGIFLAILMLIALLNSSYFFLVVLRLSIGQWLAFNACSLAIIIYLISFVVSLVKKNSIWLSIALLPMYYYGTMGLFIMPWNGVNLFAHITHLIITGNIIWAIFCIYKEHKYAESGKYLLFSMIIFVPVFTLIQTYNQTHLNKFMQILQSM
ncbi:MAG: hypothetical protein PHG06_14535 [Parabacteroides sp.]|nr:hypothetical protein [Parabacteroides sp.]